MKGLHRGIPILDADSSVTRLLAEVRRRGGDVVTGADAPGFVINGVPVRERRLLELAWEFVDSGHLPPPLERMLVG